LKGSNSSFRHDEDCTYSLPRYEPNFVFLFGIEEMDIDGIIDLSNNNTYLIK